MRKEYRWVLEIAFSLSIGYLLFDTKLPFYVSTILSIIVPTLILFHELNKDSIEQNKNSISQVAQQINFLSDNFEKLRAQIPEIAVSDKIVPKPFKDIFDRKLEEISEIYSGRIRIKRRTRDQMWTLHRERFQTCDSNIDFIATCLVPEKPDDIEDLFSNKAYLNYCQSSYEHIANSKTSTLKKIYILRNKQALKVPSFREHLVKIQTQANKNERILPKILIHQEYMKDYQNFPDNSDFMIWGNELLALSQMKAMDYLIGVDLIANEDEIKSKIKEFNSLFENPLCRPIPNKWKD